MYNDLKPLKKCLKFIDGDPNSGKFNKNLVRWSAKLFAAQIKVEDNFEKKLYQYRKNPKKALIYFDGYSLQLLKMKQLFFKVSDVQRKYLDVIYNAMNNFLHREYLCMVIFGGVDIFDTPFNDLDKINAKQGIKVDDVLKEIKKESQRR